MVSDGIAGKVEDLMTEVWVLIGETRFLFGHPAKGWKIPNMMRRTANMRSSG
jgi:hypothetical protein